MTSLKIHFDAVNLLDAFQAGATFRTVQAFKAGDLKIVGGRPEALVDGAGNLLQMDQWNRHPSDPESVGMAIVSGVLPDLAAGEKRVVGYAKGTPKAAAEIPAGRFDTYSEITFYQPQKSGIYYSNRNGNTTPGIEFVAGEELTITLTDKIGTETVTYRVPEELAGPGHFPRANSLARQIEELIRKTQRFHAEVFWEERSQVTTKNPAGGAFTVAVSKPRKAPITYFDIQPYKEPKVYRATPKLDEKRLRMVGPVAREYDLPTPYLSTADGSRHPVLQARFLPRFHARSVCHQLVVENNATFAAGAGNLLFGMVWAVDGKVVKDQDVYKHYHHSSAPFWHWTGSRPSVYVRQRMQYMQDSGLLYNFDQNLRISEARKRRAAKLVQDYARALDPMANPSMATGWPGTGGREEIGAQPQWVAEAQVDEDRRLDDYAIMMATVACTVPMQYRDENTDQPVDLSRHWGISRDNGFSQGGQKLPDMADSTTPWQVESDHQPSPSFYAYLRTGDAVFLRNVQYWANWNILNVYPQYRQGARAVSTGGQVRGMAWNLRSLGEANWVTPEAHPLRRYFQDRLAVNLQDYVVNYVRKSDAPLHNMEGGKAPIGGTRPWMNDFLAFPVAQMALLGLPNAKEFATFLAKFISGRWLDPKNASFALRHMGTAYTFDTWNYDTKNPRIFQTWDEVIAFMFPKHEPSRPETWGQFKNEKRPMRDEAYTDIPLTEAWVGGYGGVASGANGALADLFPEARKAFELIEFKLAPGFQREFNDNPSYGIVPRGYVRPPYRKPETAVAAARAPAAPLVLTRRNSVPENETFTVDRITTVRYGSATAFIDKTLPAGTHACSNATFGDPAVGVVKSCALAPAPGAAPVRSSAHAPATSAGLAEAMDRLRRSLLG